ncbi:MAG: hypothetical protein AAB484_00980 [Patescibacteria group bacterium]
MFWNKYFWPSFLVMILVVGLHWFALLNDIYDTVQWYDIVMHFLGGLWVFLFVLWAIHTQYGRFFLKHASIRNLIFFVLVVGVLWEILEIVLGFMHFSDPGYGFDVFKDLVIDILGAICGSIFYKK